MELILASKSPRRLEILNNLGLSVRVMPTDADETVTDPCSPQEFVQILANRKASFPLPCTSDDLIIACDTVVSFEDKILGKPHDASEARQMLTLLRGKTHSVFSGLALRRGEKLVCAAERTDVCFRFYSDAEIDAYIESNEPFDKAGAYGIQGLGGMFVKYINGDHFNVMGLPVYQFGRLFAKATGSEILLFGASKLL